MTTPCPHCHVEIEIDASAQTAFRGQTEFPCPACLGVVPMLASSHSTPVSFAQRALSKSHRNLKMLGAMALLALGGIGIFLASQKAGNTYQTTENIRNDILNNAYFTRLISEGVTTRDELETIQGIRSYGDGYIGISKMTMDWEMAIERAKLTGSAIIDVGQPPDHRDEDRIAWLLNKFPEDATKPLWVSASGNAAVLVRSEILPLSIPGGKRQVILHWNAPQNQFDTSRTRDEPPVVIPWVDPSIPKPDADGWITLFDGVKLYGCDPEQIAESDGGVWIQDGTLVIDHHWVTFHIYARNIAFRALVKKVEGNNLGMGFRAASDRFYQMWYNGGGSNWSAFGLGYNDPIFKDIKGLRASRDFPDFAPVEITARDHQITIKAGDETLDTIVDDKIDQPGAVFVKTFQSKSMFRNIRVNILDNSDQ